LVALAITVVFAALALSRPESKSPKASSPPPENVPAVAGTAAAPVADGPTAPTVRRPLTVTYSALHRHRFGGQCNGIVRLDASTFRYESSQHPITQSRQDVRRIDGPGFVDGDGKKWHFRVEGKTDHDLERMLTGWFAHGQVH